jgi:hypothetical protein
MDSGSSLLVSSLPYIGSFINFGFTAVFEPIASDFGWSYPRDFPRSITSWSVDELSRTNLFARW